MVPVDLYFWVVTVCGLIYSGISQFIRGKIVDMKRMKELQKELNAVNKEYLEAVKKQNQKKMEEMQKKQGEIMPEFNGIMMGQFKVMIVIIAVFMSFMWGLGQIDPNLEDDFSIEMEKSGEQWCGEIPLSAGTRGPWYVDVKAFEGDQQRAQNGTILYNGVEGSSFLPSGTIVGEKMHIFSDKESYGEDDVAVVCAKAPAYTDRIEATANSGTWFHIKLPFEIPFFNTRTLNGVNIWFILVAILGGLAMGRIKKVIDK